MTLLIVLFALSASGEEATLTTEVILEQLEAQLSGSLLQNARDIVAALNSRRVHTLTLRFPSMIAWSRQ